MAHGSQLVFVLALLVEGCSTTSYVAVDAGRDSGAPRDANIPDVLPGYPLCELDGALECPNGTQCDYRRSYRDGGSEYRCMETCSNPGGICESGAVCERSSVVREAAVCYPGFLPSAGYCRVGAPYPECPFGQVCWGTLRVIGGGRGTCVEGCSSDADCESGETCMNVSGRNGCVVPCTTSEQCSREDMALCFRGRCQSWGDSHCEEAGLSYEQCRALPQVPCEPACPAGEICIYPAADGSGRCIPDPHRSD